MSLKYAVVREGPNRYVLPRLGEMKCEVVAFLSEDLYDRTDEDLWADAKTSASYPGATGMYLMPDCHKGYVLPVGGVLVTDGVIVQAGSGYDISCGVVYLRAPGLGADGVRDWDRRRKWVTEVERRIATGVGTYRPELMRVASRRDMGEIFRYGAKALGVPAEQCERHYIEVGGDFDENLVERATDKAAPQLGSVGGGNHFVEMQVDRDDGSVWIMIHCGSRGFGWQTANHFFYAGAETRGIPKNRREESYLFADEPMGRAYWAHHNAAANYAIANRHTIVGGVRDATREVFAADVEVYYEISHNLVQQETLVLPDGTTKRGFVHRKGATRAFPAGHPDLAGTAWFETGHPCLIPGSMLDGAAILFPKPGAYRSACSVNHGSGRHMGRGEAKRQLEAIHDEIDHEMRTVERTCGGVTIRGIVGNTERTPLDECGHVYKNLDQVLAVLEAEDVAEVRHRMYPVANIKGTD
jgi:tRNA-splicing ligase RtcB